ncbi:MAG: sodium:solute symporter family transporter [Bacteroidaceae bacterium]|jgi:SSS family solute:Na+ symporter|nr:sodium/solute symporter [Bacteroidaceae bacterium]HOD68305.1 sodium/solute symporter [Bacteroidaceae bacterium]HQL25659.1 sodium/solute symporter [Bacteroidaceae bacterium]
MNNSILEGLSNNGFHTIDYIIFLVYLVILVFLGFFVSRKKDGQEKTSKDYFLAGNTLTWWAVGASLIAANISAEQFIGMSGSAYASGIAIAAYELMAALTLVVVAKFILPVMIKNKVFTIPQFLTNRYNQGVGLAFSIFWLFLYVFINLTSVAWLGALAIEQILGVKGAVLMIGETSISVRLLIIIFLYMIAGLYSIYGGLASVAWTDVMQVIFLVGGGLVTAWFALATIAPHLGVQGAIPALGEVMSRLGDIPGDRHFSLVVERQAELYPNIKDDPYFTLPGIVLIIGALWLTNLGYWGFNQYIIQKGLAAKNIDEAKKGLVFAGFLKILIPFIVCIPGVCAYLIWNDADLHSRLMSQGLLNGSINVSDDAYPFLIRNFTPVVVKGLSFAALTAAVISSLASMFNSTSTIFTIDIYKQFMNKNASERRLVAVGRLTALAALVIALIAVYPIMGGADQAFQIIQEYSGFVYPGIVVIFSLGLLWKRSSGLAAIVTAIGTFLFSVLFKLIMPNTPFLIRMGYVFFVLVILFVSLSLLSKNTVPAKPLDEHTIKTQLKWSSILFASSIICYVLGIIVMFCKASWCLTLQNLGFEGIFFLATMFLVLSIYLKSNAKDKVQDPKAIEIDLSLFRTNTQFNIGAFGIIVLLAILYITLW